MTERKRPMRTPEEKLQLVLAASALEGEELGAFLRQEGIHEVELRDWRKAMLDGLGGGRPAKGANAAGVRRLEKELRRKDKALAEYAALVVLKKKAQALGLLEPEDESTDPKSGDKS